MEVARSVNGLPIRLTAERWFHIVDARDELVGREDDVLATIRNPDWVTRGYRGSLVAWKSFGRSGYLSVIYKELRGSDGFVITAFFTTKAKKRNCVWPR